MLKVSCGKNLTTVCYCPLRWRCRSSVSPTTWAFSIVHDACCTRQILCNPFAFPFPCDGYEPIQAGLVEGKPDRIVTLALSDRTNR